MFKYIKTCCGEILTCHESTINFESSSNGCFVDGNFPIAWIILFFPFINKLSRFATRYIFIYILHWIK